jgi:hypothetical protein
MASDLIGIFTEAGDCGTEDSFARLSHLRREAIDLWLDLGDKGGRDELIIRLKR